MDDDAETPPDHPAWGVFLSDQFLENLLRQCNLEPWTNITIQPLSHKQSYNNRVYIIHTETSSGRQLSYVLKVNGRFFGAAKVENEVSCLLLLNHFCPNLPVPKVLAWSQDGQHITRRAEDGTLTRASIDIATEDGGLPAWILMTFLPGSPIVPSELSLEEMEDLAVQLARVLATWRHRVPRMQGTGNIHFSPRRSDPEETDPSVSTEVSGMKLYMYGSVGTGNDSGPSARLISDYWKNELEWQLQQLSENEIHASNRPVIQPAVQDFINDILPKLTICQSSPESSNFVFTHTDLFPRNVLVHGNPPRLSGIVDFEFSGFFPETEEFVEDWLPDDDGSQWPLGMYDKILTELELSGVQTPRTMPPRGVEEARLLNVVREHIAPWWIRATDGLSEDETATRLQESRALVQRAILELSSLTSG